MLKRRDGREPGELRPLAITPHYLRQAEGSALIQLGETRVICSASLEEKAPPFLRGTGKGWLTSEYGMLPRSTRERTQREASRGRVAGRTAEIQRLIGRSLRAVVDLGRLGERTLWVDCDVIEADGGTRTAAISGAFVALVLALRNMQDKKTLGGGPLPVRDFVAATSVGLVGGERVLDLNYDEDSQAEVDMNIVKTGRGRFIEIQGTAESKPFDEPELAELFRLADRGIRQIVSLQAEVLGPIELLPGT